jgi:hypothetical protein
LVVAVAALALFSTAASAGPSSNSCHPNSPIIGWLDNLFDITPDCGSSGGGKGTTAPEIDAASTISAVSLLLGGLLVLRGRKARA